MVAGRARPGFGADDEQIQDVRQGPVDAVLPLADLKLEEDTGAASNPDRRTGRHRAGYSGYTIPRTNLREQVRQRQEHGGHDPEAEVDQRGAGMAEAGIDQLLAHGREAFLVLGGPVAPAHQQLGQPGLDGVFFFGSEGARHKLTHPVWQPCPLMVRRLIPIFQEAINKDMWQKRKPWPR